MSNSVANRLLDRNYVPDVGDSHSSLVSDNTLVCPITFTEDPIEFCEGAKFLGSSLRPLQRDFLRDLYAVDEKKYPKHDTGVFIAGMRGGKSALAAMIASFQLHRLLALDSPAQDLHQLKGQRLTIQFIAASEAQAKETAYAAFEAIIGETYWFSEYTKWLRKREVAQGLAKGSLFEQLTNKIEFHEKKLAVLSLHSNSAALVGKTSACCIFDELSRFDVGEGAVQARSQKRTAQAVYDGVAKAATSLVPFSKVVTITSPMYEDDYGMRLLYMSGTFTGGAESKIIEVLRRQYPMKVDRMVGYHATTFELNPKYNDKEEMIPGGFSEEDAFFKAKRIESPEAYRRDFLAIPPSAISPFFEYPERIDRCIVKNPNPKVIFENSEFQESVDKGVDVHIRTYIGKRTYIIKPDQFTEYYISCDQGEKKDAFVIAMGHAEPVAYETRNAQGVTVTLERYKVVVDILEGWMPDKERRVTVSFPNVDDTILLLNDNFHIKKVVFDQWNSTESIQRLFSRGIVTEKTNPAENLRKYEILKTLVYSGLIELPVHDVLHRELRQLNLIKGKKVDHAEGSSSDFADAVARVAWEVYFNVIEQAIQGNYMQPMQQRMPNLRGMGSHYDWISGDLNDQPGSSNGVSSGDIFGKGIQVKQNIFPNLHTK